MHWKSLFAFACTLTIALAGWGTGCSHSSLTDSDAGVGGEAGINAACPPCVTNQDCGGGVCAQIAGDTFCMPVCPMGSECSADRACTSVTTISGQQASACIPRGDACGPAGEDAGIPPSSMCGTLVGPDVASTCACSAGKTCSANGCYGGWWCDTATMRCHAPPTNCGSGPGGGVPYDAGPPVTSQITGSGGTMNRLLVGVVGDTRPANIDDTAGYPTPIITKIFSDLDALASKPPLVVTTGDYMFASTAGSQAGPQLDLYLGARAIYSGVTFPAMGNHECTGATASNCGTGAADGVTANYTTFIAKMLGPVSKSDPYYAVNVTLDGGLTAKFVFIAANAWSPAQQTWLDSTLAQPTTYTFIVRHESKSANTAPGVTPSEQVMAAHPYTLSIVGHTHTYSHYAGREVIVGNGGAPVTGGKNYGFGMLSQRDDGAIQVDMIDYQSGLADGSFRFAVHPDGSAAP